MVKLKEVSQDELINRISYKASRDFDKWFSNDVDDWGDDLRNAESNGEIVLVLGDDVLFKCHIEISEKQHTELYDFFVLNCNDGENYIDTKYYLEMEG